MKKLNTLGIIFCSLINISCKKDNTTNDDTLYRAVQWMWQQQSEDGGWHSKTHAVLRDGKVFTPYILYHLLFVPEEIYTPDQNSIDRAADFIEREMMFSLNADSTGLTDYPNYSAAYALLVLNFLDRDSLIRTTIANYLISQQFNEHRGFTPDSLVYGGWGYGEPDLPLGVHGHVDISHTRRVIEALSETDLLTKEITDKVKHFIKGVQRDPDDTRRYAGCISKIDIPYDGGLVASVVTMSTIKSEPVEIESAGIHYPSYATATCDGFLTMHAMGMQQSNSYVDAKNWLLKNQNIHTIDGLPEDDPEQWNDIMHYYHMAVRAKAMSIIEPDGSWKTEIEEVLVKEQTPEGYYINPIGGVNKEDDPLMATIFCIQALTR